MRSVILFNKRICMYVCNMLVFCLTAQHWPNHSKEVLQAVGAACHSCCQKKQPQYDQLLYQYNNTIIWSTIMQLLLREVTHTATQEKPRANNLMSSSN